MKKTQFISDILLIIFASLLSAVGLYTFVNPANFAPSGVDGIAMMLHKLFGINIGYVSLIINIPLLIIAWLSINRKYVIYTLLFTLTSSVALIAMEEIHMYEYVTTNNLWLSVCASGIMLGIRTALMIKIGGSSGGIDIVACMIQKKKPYLNIESLISLFCYIIIGLSFFVYRNLESVLMSVVQMMVFNMAMNYVLKTTRNAVEVRIITKDPENFRHDILKELKHGATTMSCNGMFTGDEQTMIVTIINIRQMNELIKITKKYPNSFVYFSDVNGVWGNFRWNKYDAVV